MIESSVGLPGKIIAVNDADSDGDGIPGFADGFDWDASEVWDDRSLYDNFVPIVLQLPAEIDVSTATLDLTYLGADPKNVQHNSQWETGPGFLRIWKNVVNTTTRNMNRASGISANGTLETPGDYVAPSRYTDLSLLGFSSAERTKTFYVETVRPSVTPGDLKITVRVGSAIDMVNLTAVRANIDINRKNGTTVAQDMEQSNGSVVQIVPTTNPSGLYPDGIFLTIPKISVQPESLASLFTMKLKKIAPANSAGKIRVYRRREEYAAHIAPLSNANQMVFTNWIGQLFVDQKYIIEPLSPGYLNAANAWKVSYLQRLRREQMDESYINAYLKSWNLSAAEVFSQTNH